MTTYIVNSGNSKINNFVAVEAANKKEAYEKVKAVKGSAQKTSISISSCHIDYVTCEKI
jgi:hypothetical protein